MSSSFERTLRAMSTTLVVLLSLAVAGALAWTVRRIESSREPRPTACTELLDKVFTAGAGETPDDVLLTHLLDRQAECMSDTTWVEQVRRLMSNTQQHDRARALLDDAKRRNTFNADELALQVAWVDLAESHMVWANGDESRAASLYERAVASANALRTRWPEWPAPYLVLADAEGESWAKGPSSARTEWYQVEQRAQSRVLNGAWFRSLSDWQPVLFAFVISAIGVLALCASLSGLLAARDMQHLATSSIADARPGYVELTGTLHLPRGADAVVGPRTHATGVWYDFESNNGFKGSRTSHEQSLQPFVLRDASGEAIISPKDMTVHTSHVDGTVGQTSGVGSSRRETERMLREGDTVYVRGQLSDTTSANGEPARMVGIAPNGKQLLVSNLTEKQLTFIEHAWAWIGVSVFLLAVGLLSFSYYQRYLVHALPG